MRVPGPPRASFPDGARRDVSPATAQTELLAEELIDFLIIFRRSPPSCVTAKADHKLNCS